MRRLLALLGLIGLGVLLGFVVRLVWPRPSSVDDEVYPGPQEASEARRTA